ncbi:MAG: hypothetical protein JNM46_00300 [Anaerolineales bacterium]|nr:hypothetical protein [Anaerolineales bacterium]
MNENLINNTDLKVRALTFALGLPWFELLARIWKIGKKIFRGFADEGIYEVLDYECQIELKDTNGENATIKKREKIRYLQDYVLSYQDWAWGDVDVFLNYRCSPGIPVDQFRLGHKTCKLISLREFRNKGDIDEFNIEWDMQNGFLKNIGFWGTGIRYNTQKINLKIIFPQGRPPINVSITESNLQRTQILGPESRRLLLDGRIMIVWENLNPRLHENYVLKWEW